MFQIVFWFCVLIFLSQIKCCDFFTEHIHWDRTAHIDIWKFVFMRMIFRFVIIILLALLAKTNESALLFLTLFFLSTDGRWKSLEPTEIYERSVIHLRSIISWWYFWYLLWDCWAKKNVHKRNCNFYSKDHIKRLWEWKNSQCDSLWRNGLNFLSWSKLLLEISQCNRIGNL